MPDDLDVQIYNRALRPDHILTLNNLVSRNKRTKKMYKLKAACVEQGLKNGEDFLFLNSYLYNDSMSIWFKDSSWVSFFAVKFLENE